MDVTQALLATYGVLAVGGYVAKANLYFNKNNRKFRGNFPFKEWTMTYLMPIGLDITVGLAIDFGRHFRRRHQ